MMIYEEFMKSLSEEIINHQNDLLLIRECLIRFREAGMDKESMIKNLEAMRGNSDSKTEDILLELMDFVVGYCNPSLAIYD